MKKRFARLRIHVYTTYTWNIIFTSTNFGFPVSFLIYHKKERIKILNDERFTTLMPSSHKSWIKLPFIVVLKNVEINPCYSVINNNDQHLKITNKTLPLFYLVACWLLRCFSLFHFFQAEKLQDISWFLYSICHW